MEHTGIESEIKLKEICKRVFSAIKTTTIIYMASVLITLLIFAIMS